MRRKNPRAVLLRDIQLLFLNFADQLNRRERAKVHAQTAIAATLDIQIRRLSRIGLHNRARLARLDRFARGTGLAFVIVDADADGAGHAGEYNRFIHLPQIHPVD